MSVADKQRRRTGIVCGVGINDADYTLTKYEVINGMKTLIWICPIYLAWRAMLRRAYTDSFKQKHPTYNGVTVCKEWLLFSAFRGWAEAQDYEGKQLDKDLLVEGNKEYSPDTCVFVDRQTNTFMSYSADGIGDWPVGVSLKKDTGKFRSRCNNPFTSMVEDLGNFASPDEAHQAWRRRKHELACQYADIQVDQRIATALRTRYLPEVKSWTKN